MRNMKHIKYTFLAVLFTVLSIVLISPVKASTINTPEITSAEMSKIEDRAIKITWDNKNVGAGYTTELNNLTTGEKNRFANSVTHYTFQGAQKDVTYQFQIRVCTTETENEDEADCSEWSAIKEITYDDTLQAIILDESCSILTVAMGDTIELTVVQMIPGDSTADVNWASSNESVATVDAEGKVTAVGPGDATITASSDDVSTMVGIHVVSDKKPLTNISLNKTALSLETGQSQKLTITYVPSDTTDSKTATWSSSNESIAKVDSDGKVTAVATGQAIITAKVGDKTSTCVVTVAQATRPLKSIKFSQKNYYVVVGKTKTLKVVYNPSNTTDSKTIKWKTADKNTVSFPAVTGDPIVNKKTVKGVKVGKTTITATMSKNSSILAETTVHVLEKAVALTGISLKTTKPTISVGQTATITTTYSPSNTTTGRGLSWTSSDPSIATVVSNGMTGQSTVTGIKAGEVTITAKSTVKEKVSDTIKIKVIESQIPMTSISMKSATYSILKGQSKTFAGEVVYNPSNTTDSRNLEWTSSNEKVATVNKSTGVVKGIASGTATITAKSTSKGFTTTAKVTVSEKHTTGIVLNKTSVTISKGKTTTLSVKTWKPSDTTDSKKITWTSSNKKVATVDSNGKVKGIAKGTATITAKTGNGKKDTVKITVKAASSSKKSSSNKKGGSPSGGNATGVTKTTTTQKKTTNTKSTCNKSILRADEKTCLDKSNHKWSGKCVNGKISSTCTCKSGYTKKNGKCVKPSSSSNSGANKKTKNCAWGAYKTSLSCPGGKATNQTMTCNSANEGKTRCKPNGKIGSTSKCVCK